jgi:16S rRNA (guanine527-N7)-methyltransferase
MGEPVATDAAALIGKAAALGISVAGQAARQLLAYLDAVLALNHEINLTGIRDREQGVVLHVLDSLACGRLQLQPRHTLDIGSGNGFPGVAVAALHPGAGVVLLDRTGKKVRAMGACLVTAGMPRVETMHVDAAQAPALHRELRQAFDLVTARAVGQPASIAALAAPFLRPGGQLLLWLDADAEHGARLGPFRRQEVVEYDLPEPAARNRLLVQYRLR